MKDYMNTPTVPITGALTGIMKTTAEENKALVLRAFDTLFNKRDYATAAASFWSPNYIQHSAHIEPGRDGLFNLITEPARYAALRDTPSLSRKANYVHPCTGASRETASLRR